MSETAQSIEPKESLKRATPTLIVLPEVKDEQTYYKEFMDQGLFKMPEFSQIVTHNLKILDSVETIRLSDKDKEYLERVKNFLCETWERYGDRLETLKSAQSSLAIIRSHIHRDGSAPAHLKDIRNIIEDGLKISEGPTVVISESHVTTYPLVQELKKNLSPDARIGLIVFDTHVDIFDGGLVPHKVNVLKRLLRGHDKATGKMLIHRATVVGSPESLLESSRGGSSDPKKFSPMLRIIGEKDFSKSSARALMEKEVNGFEKAGISHIMVSVDVDVFRSHRLRYTGAEYNPLHALLWFGQSSLEGVKQDPQALISRLRYNDLESPSVLQEPELLGGKGLSLGDIGIAVDTMKIEADKKGMQFGVPIGEARVLGDIVELSGPDFGGNTARAALALAARIGG